MSAIRFLPPHRKVELSCQMHKEFKAETNNCSTERQASQCSSSAEEITHNATHSVFLTLQGSNLTLPGVIEFHESPAGTGVPQSSRGHWRD